MKNISVSINAVVLTLIFSVSCYAQDQAQQIENAIQMLQSSGQAEPRALAAMYASAAQLHLQSGNMDKAMERVQFSLKLCRQHSIQGIPEMSLRIAGNIIGKSDDEAASKFLAQQLNAPDADPQYKKAVLNILGQQMLTSGNIVSALRIQQQRLKMVQAQSPGTLEEAQTLLDLGRNCLTAAHVNPPVSVSFFSQSGKFLLLVASYARSASGLLLLPMAGGFPYNRPSQSAFQAVSVKPSIISGVFQCRKKLSSSEVDLQGGQPQFMPQEPTLIRLSSKAPCVPMSR